jgi:hypothetical protein
LGAARRQEQAALPTVLFKGAGHRRVLPFFNQMVIMAKHVTKDKAIITLTCSTVKRKKAENPTIHKLAGRFNRQPR